MSPGETAETTCMRLLNTLAERGEIVTEGNYYWSVMFYLEEALGHIVWSQTGIDDYASKIEAFDLATFAFEEYGNAVRVEEHQTASQVQLCFNLFRSLLSNLRKYIAYNEEEPTTTVYLKGETP